MSFSDQLIDTATIARPVSVRGADMVPRDGFEDVATPVAVRVIKRSDRATTRAEDGRIIADHTIIAEPIEPHPEAGYPGDGWRITVHEPSAYAGDYFLSSDAARARAGNLDVHHLTMAALRSSG